MKRRKFTSRFKTKVVLDSLKEYCSLKELAQKYEIHPSQISTWKKEFMSKVDEVFSKPCKDAKSEEEKERDELLRTIGQLKVENDFLKKILK